ncbi:hypothetical protein SNEBB_005043 [Seison nebaliae]|nr:hypothetical protein SNEBB_005043 [Seison nebaliae]
MTSLTEVEQLLVNSLNPETANEASKQLDQLNKKGDTLILYCMCLLNENTPNDVKLAAATVIKNLVTKNWLPIQTSELTKDLIKQEKFFLPMEVRREFRSIMGKLLFKLHESNSDLMKLQILQSIYKVLRSDFPEECSSFLDDILDQLKNNKFKWYDACRAYYQLVKSCIFNPPDKRRIFEKSVKEFLPYFKNICELIRNDTSKEATELKIIILKILRGTCKYNLSLDIFNNQVMSEWMNEILIMWKCETPPLPKRTQDEDEEDVHYRLTECCWVKLKKWCTHFLVMIFERYASPANCKKIYIEFARWWRKEYSLIFTKEFISYLSKENDKIIQFRSDATISDIICFLRMGIENSYTWKHIKTIMNNLIREIIYPLMCLSDKHEKLFNDNPLEFIAVKLDAFSTSDPVDRCCQRLLTLLARTRKGLLHEIMEITCQLLQESMEFMNKGNDKLFLRHLDGGLNMLACIAPLMVKNHQYMETVLTIVNKCIIPQLLSDKNSFLVIRCLWCLGELKEFPFDNEMIGKIYAILLYQMGCANDIENERRSYIQSLIGKELLEKSTIKDHVRNVKIKIENTDNHDDDDDNDDNGIVSKVQAIISIDKWISSVPLMKEIVNNDLTIIMRCVILRYRQTEFDELADVVDSLIDYYPKETSLISLEIAFELFALSYQMIGDAKLSAEIRTINCQMEGEELKERLKRLYWNVLEMEVTNDELECVRSTIDDADNRHLSMMTIFLILHRLVEDHDKMLGIEEIHYIYAIGIIRMIRLTSDDFTEEIVPLIEMFMENEKYCSKIIQNVCEYVIIPSFHQKKKTYEIFEYLTPLSIFLLKNEDFQKSPKKLFDLFNALRRLLSDDNAEDGRAILKIFEVILSICNKYSDPIVKVEPVSPSSLPPVTYHSIGVNILKFVYESFFKMMQEVLEKNFSSKLLISEALTMEDIIDPLLNQHLITLSYGLVVLPKESMGMLFEIQNNLFKKNFYDLHPKIEMKKVKKIVLPSVQQRIVEGQNILIHFIKIFAFNLPGQQGTHDQKILTNGTTQLLQYLMGQSPEDSVSVETLAFLLHQSIELIEELKENTEPNGGNYENGSDDESDFDDDDDPLINNDTEVEIVQSDEDVEDTMANYILNVDRTEETEKEENITEMIDDDGKINDENDFTGDGEHMTQDFDDIDDVKGYDFHEEFDRKLEKIKTFYDVDYKINYDTLELTELSNYRNCINSLKEFPIWNVATNLMDVVELVSLDEMLNKKR